MSYSSMMPLATRVIGPKACITPLGRPVDPGGVDEQGDVVRLARGLALDGLDPGDEIIEGRQAVAFRGQRQRDLGHVRRDPVLHVVPDVELAHEDQLAVGVVEHELTVSASSVGYSATVV